MEPVGLKGVGLGTPDGDGSTDGKTDSRIIAAWRLASLTHSLGNLFQEEFRTGSDSDSVIISTRITGSGLC